MKTIPMNGDQTRLNVIWWIALHTNIRPSELKYRQIKEGEES